MNDDIRIEETRLFAWLHAPKHPDKTRLCRAAGGRWDAHRRAWCFPIGRWAQVAAIAWRLWGWLPDDLGPVPADAIEIARSTRIDPGQVRVVLRVPGDERVVIADTAGRVLDRLDPARGQFVALREDEFTSPDELARVRRTVAARAGRDA